MVEVGADRRRKVLVTADEKRVMMELEVSEREGKASVEMNNFDFYEDVWNSKIVIWLCDFLWERHYFVSVKSQAHDREWCVSR